MEPLYDCAGKCFRRNRLLKALLCGIVAVELLATGDNVVETNATAAESDKPDWKPTLGEWYTFTDPAGHKWEARDLATFQGKVAATFLLRRADEETTEHWRAVLFSDEKRPKILPLPYNVGGKLRMKVFWYEATGEEGPFIRIADRWGEYVVDLRRKTTAETRRVETRLFAGELQAGQDKISTMSVSRHGDTIEVEASNGPAREVTHLLKQDKEELVGEIRSDGR